MLLEMPQRNDPSVNRPIAEANTRRVPNRSAIQPLMGMKHGEAQRVAGQHRFHAERRDLESAAAMAGTAVFRIVVSSDSMKKATATSHGNSRALVSLRLRNESAGASGVTLSSLRVVESCERLSYRMLGKSALHPTQQAYRLSQSKDLYPQPSADSRVLRLRESARKTSELTAFRMTWQLHIRLLSPNELTIQANRFAYATWSLARSPIRR